MNERYELNSELVRAWLDKESRKNTYLSHQLMISDSLVNKMLAGRHVPKDRTLAALAALVGVNKDQLLILKKKAKKAG